MKKILYGLSLFVFALLTVVHIAMADGIGTLPQLQQFVASTSPVSAITQNVYGKSLRLTGLENLSCIGTDSNGVLGIGTCSGGGGSGTGTVATSTPLVSGQVDFSTSASTIGNDATFLFSTAFKRLTTSYASTTAFTNSGNSYLGTVASGLWNGTVISPTYGGNLFDLDTNTPLGTPLNNVYRLRHSFNNFLSNSSFEFWLAGTSVAPSGWTLSGDATVARSSTATIDSYSAAITFGTANTGEFYQDVGISTLVDYTYSAYVQRTSGTGSARLVAQQEGSPFTEFASVPLSTTAGWQLITLSVKPSAGTQMRFSIKSSNTTASTWLIDEAMFQESKNVATTYLPKYLDDTTNVTIFGTPNFLGSIGVSSTSPSSILSVGTTNGINLRENATSTFGAGINLVSGGCFAIAGNCINGSISSGGISNPFTNSVLGSIQASATTSLMLLNGNASTTGLSAGYGYFGTTATSSFSNAGILTLTNLNGLLKGSTGVVGTASNGTDYTLISANTCSAGQHVSAVTAAGVFTCSPDSGSGGGSFPFAATTNFNQVVYATSTPTLWFQSGLFASSTSWFDNLNVASKIGIATTVPAVALDVNGQIYANNNSLVLPGYAFNNAPGYGIGYQSAGAPSAGNLLLYANNVLGLVLTPNSSNYRIPSGYEFSWSSATDNLASSDTGLSRLSAGVVGVGNGTAGTSAGTFIAGKIGIASSTPGSLLSVGTTNGVNLLENATSTFGRGIDIRGGCFSINGTCISSGAVTGLTSYDAFTHTPVFGQTTSATSTLLALTGSPFSLVASSTVVFVNASTTMISSDLASSTTFIAGRGTASLPSYSFTNQPNLGIFATTDGINFSSAGTNRLSIVGTSAQFSNTTVGGAVARQFSMPANVTAPSITLPAYGFGNDTNTGLWSQYADALNLTAGGTEVLRSDIASTSIPVGNFGIGTTSPGTLLSVQGVANFTTATSTFQSTGGINLTNGCFSIAGNCITGGVGGGVSSVTATYPVLSTGGTTPVISLAFGTTTSNTWGGTQTFGTVTISTTTAGILKTSPAGVVYASSATSTLQVFNAFTTPDTGGNSWIQSSTINGSASVLGSMVYIASSTTAKTGFFGTQYIPDNFASSSAQVVIDWTATSTSNAVVWNFDYRCVGGTNTTSLYGTTYQESKTVTSNNPSTAGFKITSNMDINAGYYCSAGNTMQYYLYRDGTNGADTSTVDAEIYNAVIKYPTL